MQKQRRPRNAAVFLVVCSLSTEHGIEVVEHLGDLDTGSAGFGGQLVIVAAHDSLFHCPGHSGLGVGADLGRVGEGIHHGQVVYGSVISLIHRKAIQEHGRLLTSDGAVWREGGGRGACDDLVCVAPSHALTVPCGIGNVGEGQSHIGHVFPACHTVDDHGKHSTGHGVIGREQGVRGACEITLLKAMTDSVVAPIVDRNVREGQMGGLDIRGAPGRACGVFHAHGHLQPLAVGTGGGGDGDAEGIGGGSRRQRGGVGSLAGAGGIRFACQLDDLVGEAGGSCGRIPVDGNILSLVSNGGSGDGGLGIGRRAQACGLGQVDPAPFVQILGVTVVAGNLGNGEALPCGQGGESGSAACGRHEGLGRVQLEDASTVASLGHPCQAVLQTHDGLGIVAGHGGGGIVYVVGVVERIVQIRGVACQLVSSCQSGCLGQQGAQGASLRERNGGTGHNQDAVGHTAGAGKDSLQVAVGILHGQLGRAAAIQVDACDTPLRNEIISQFIHGQARVGGGSATGGNQHDGAVRLDADGTSLGSGGIEGLAQPVGGGDVLTVGYDVVAVGDEGTVAVLHDSLCTCHVLGSGDLDSVPYYQATQGCGVGGAVGGIQHETVGADGSARGGTASDGNHFALQSAAHGKLGVVNLLKDDLHACRLGVGVGAAELVVIVDARIGGFGTDVDVLHGSTPCTVLGRHGKGHLGPNQLCLACAVKSQHPGLPVAVTALQDLAVGNVYAAVGVAACPGEGEEGSVDSALDIVAEGFRLHSGIVGGVPVARIFGVYQGNVVTCLGIEGEGLHPLTAAGRTADVEIVISHACGDGACGCA